jgi:hypothetical protein
MAFFIKLLGEAPSQGPLPVLAPVEGANGRGRDAGYPAPPAQIRT